MRVDRLDLTRFGHFSDFTLDFGIASSEPDLHIIYGPNEAGKSTTLAALVDLLFGMPRSSDFDFLHQYQTMELGARLTQNGVTREIRRFKNRLTDADRNQLAETSIDVHGLSREDFTNRFSFDDNALQEGGESILQSRGDLGAALFSASSGLADIAQRMDAAMAAPDRFHDGSNSRKTELYSLRKELEELDAKRKEIDIEAPAWKRHKREMLAAQERYTAQENRLRELQHRLDSLKSQRLAKKTAILLDVLQRQLVEFETRPRVPESWHSQLSTLQPQQIRLSTQLSAMLEQKQQLKSKLQMIKPDQAVLQQAQAIEELAGRRLLITQQVAETIKLTGQHGSVMRQLDSLKRQLGIATDSNLVEYVVPAATLVQLEELALSHAGLVSTLEQSQKEWHRVDERNTVVSDAVITEPPDLTALQNLCTHLRNDAAHIRLEQLSERNRELQHAVADAIRLLRPWQGDAEALQDQSPPPASHLQALADTKQACEDNLRLLQSRHDECRLRADTLRRETESTRVGFIADEQTIGDSRGARDTAWQAHTDALDANSGNATLQSTAREFASALASDDALTTSRQTESNRIAKLSQLAVDTAVQQQELGDLQARLDDAGEAHNASFSAIALVADNLGLSDNHDVPAITHWLALRDQALQLLAEQSRHASEQAACEARCADQQARLCECMAEHLSASALEQIRGASLEECLPLAEQTLEHLQKVRRDHAQQLGERKNLDRELQERRKLLDENSQKLKDWQTEWQAAMGTSWLAGHEAPVVASLLHHLRELTASVDDMDKLRERIAFIKSELNRFITDSTSLVRLLPTSISQAGTSDPRHSEMPGDTAADQSGTSRFVAERTVDELESSLKTAVQDQASRERLSSELDNTEKAATALQTELQPVEQQLTDMQTHCQVKSTVDLQNALEQARTRASLEARERQAHAELVDKNNAQMTDAAIAALSQLDQTELDTDIQTSEDQLIEERQKLNDLHHAYRTAETALNTMAGEAEVALLVERRENLLIELKERAIDTLRARLGRVVVLEGLRRYRDQHRSGMMQRARDAFVTVTCNNYNDLRSHPDNKGVERLYGIKSDSTTQLSEDMSTGTRYQLYLALRIAAYHEYCQHRKPMPFVADDIMETFDDERSAAAFSLLADMARHGQVIYLTHHRHLLDIAKQVVGSGLSVYELPARLTGVV